MINATALEKFSVFDGMESSVMEKVAQISEKKSYRAGESIINEGEKADRFFLVINGNAVVERDLPPELVGRSNETVTAVHQEKAGGIFGWSSLVDPGVYTASVRSLGMSDVIEVDGKKLKEIFDAEPAAGYRFMKGLASIISWRLSDTTGRLMEKMAKG